MSIAVTLQNHEMLEEQYSLWQQNPGAVSPQWASFFEGFELGSEFAKEMEAKQGQNGESAVATADDVKGFRQLSAAPAGDGEDESLQRKVDMLIYSYRDIGHSAARLDPLKGNPSQPALHIREFGLTEEDLDRMVSSKYYLKGETLTLRELIESLQEHYSSTIGAEFMYIQTAKVRQWMRTHIESRKDLDESAEERKQRLLTLIHAETFERFLHTKYVGQKRFSLEGGESLMVILETLLQKSPKGGVEEIVMGMAHRGRLNVLSNFLQKSPKVVFTEFASNYAPDTVAGDGDVKYHLGYESIRQTDSGEEVEIRLAANPSHLEAVNPVVEGKARARQRIRQDAKMRRKVLPVLIHGDAAFAGQGVVAEVLNMSQLPGYRTGGTVHIIVNNQIGFTTLPDDARSTVYATDVAKMIDAPIFHVNGDDPDAVAFVSKLAFDYRQDFGADVVIDLYCYRRHGHNEGDEPVFTQPKLYETIRQHPSVSHVYRKQLLNEGLLEENEAEEMENSFRHSLEQHLDEVKQLEKKNVEDIFRGFLESNAVFQPSYTFDPVDTTISHDRLGEIVRGLTTMPDDFHVLPKTKRIILDRRVKVFEENGDYDWAFAEALAFGALLIEGTSVRLSGQDSRRGTFSQRHTGLYDFETGSRYTPLKHLTENAQFCVYNSLLSEAAVLGFDYGYSLDYPTMLCMWEAQFGDFANGAQVVIDQFIASAEWKWQRPSGLVMLLPHGYEGQGPEHSSARPERFLQLCASFNMQVCNPTTPAQYFHLLRRQTKRKFRKPLIVLTPKSLLRSPDAVSKEEDFTQGQFHEILDCPNTENPESVKRLIFCNGKVYYDLVEHQKENNISDTAIIRIEQLYPLHEELFKQITGRYPAVEQYVWCQEEPENMGAWTHIGLTLSDLLDAPVMYAGRDASASVAGGSMALHQRRQKRLLAEAFSD